MHALICTLIVAVFFVDFAKSEIAALPRLVTWTPELFVAGMMLLIALRGPRLRIPGRYLVWGALVIALLIVGALVNQVQPGTVFYGARKYLRWAPVLLAPLAYSFSKRQLMVQLQLILALALFQIVPAAYQRFIQYPGFGSGDVVTGTIVTGPGQLSILLLGSMCMLTAFFIRGRLGFFTYACAASVLAIPTFLNETAAAIVLLPMSLAVPLLLAARGNTGTRVVPVLMITGVLVAGFMLSYATLFDRWGGDPTEVIKGGGVEYMYRGATADSRADEGREHSEIGRLDSVVMPFLVLDDPIKWLTGVGIGNASTVFNNVFAGEFSPHSERYGVGHTSASVLVWELGVLGLGLTLTFIWMAFRDASVLSKHNGLAGIIGLGWSSVMVLVFVVLIYKNIVDNSALSFLAALLSGHVIAMHRDRNRQKISGHLTHPSHRPSGLAIPTTTHRTSTTGQGLTNRSYL